MPHDKFSTSNGLLYFKVTEVDGKIHSELDKTWDEIPADAQIKEVALVDSKGRDFVTLGGYDFYVFGNEAVSCGFSGAPPGTDKKDWPHAVLTGKFIGGKVNSDDSWDISKLNVMTLEVEEKVVLDKDFPWRRTGIRTGPAPT